MNEKLPRVSKMVEKDKIPRGRSCNAMICDEKGIIRVVMK